ncbi:MAG: glycogen/starch/alpha-glucan phosphorylase [Planctomycetota bacterium]
MTTMPMEPQAIEAPDLRTNILRHASHTLGRTWGELSPREIFWAVSLAVRDRVVGQQITTESRYRSQGAKRAYYLSMEFLMGRTLGSTLANLGMVDEARTALSGLNEDLDAILNAEPDAALGNGGLGRLAACFLDSMATLGLPGFGYGINYEYGLFKQEILEGRQHERPEAWRADGTPWQITSPEQACVVPLYGRVAHTSQDGERVAHWVDCQTVVGVPCDMPIVGYGGKTVNTLRLFAARASDEFDMRIFNSGDYLRAVEGKVVSETISKVLYPSDRHQPGQELRLIQEYFLVSCAITDIMRRHVQSGPDMVGKLHELAAVQLNDTHPALAVAELMRVLVDHHRMPWDTAWAITRRTLAYTNHTLLPEALEKWPVDLIGRVLPRHLEIIFDINQRFLDDAAKAFPGDHGKLARMSIIEESSPKQVRMAHLAIVGSHSVNGVARIHTDLIRSSLVPDFAEMYPDRFNNKTNGVTPRRWMLHANPHLSRLITESIGDGWVTNLDELRGLERFIDDTGFLDEITRVKRLNKQRLATLVQRDLGFAVDPDAMFDAQVKRMHEYKRQLLNALHVVHRYLEIVDDGAEPEARVFVFSGKAAPGYERAKQIIRLICAIADTVNRDERLHGLMKVAFVPNYNVSRAEVIIPGADLSEQISTAGFEASGTGNMKFALNGALTIGTLDGANVEMDEAIGREHMFIFGNTVEQIEALRASGKRPDGILGESPTAQRVVDAIDSGRFSSGDTGAFSWVRHSIAGLHDPYFHLADLGSYIAAQQHAGQLFLDQRAWAQRTVYNIARSGRFGSDRTIREYAEEIWGVEPAI